MSTAIPGLEGSIGPFPGEYHLPHVYARDVHSGAGNCVCGGGLRDSRHVQAAPGIPVPERITRREIVPVDPWYDISMIGGRYRVYGIKAELRYPEKVIPMRLFVGAYSFHFRAVAAGERWLKKTLESKDG